MKEPEPERGEITCLILRILIIAIMLVSLVAAEREIDRLNERIAQLESKSVSN